MNQLNEHLYTNPAPAPASDNSDREQLEVTMTWVSTKLEKINGYTLAAVAMILSTLITIVWIVSN